MAQRPNSLAPVYFSTEIFQWQPSSANPLMVATVPLAQRIVTNEGRLCWGWIMASVYDGVRFSAAQFPASSVGSYLVQPVTTAGDYTPLPNLGKVLK